MVLNKGIAFLFWLTLGWVGGHRFYLNRSRTACVMMVLFLATGVASLTSITVLFTEFQQDIPNTQAIGEVFSFTWALQSVMLIWWMIDLFRLSKMVDTENLRRIVGSVPPRANTRLEQPNVSPRVGPSQIGHA